MEKAKVLVAMDKLSAIEEFAKELREFLTPLAADPPLVEPVFEDKSPAKPSPKEEKETAEEVNLDETIEEFGLNDMDEDELKEELKAVGIKVPPRAKKDKLVQLVAQAVADGKIGAEEDEEPSEETPVAEEPVEKVEAVLETAEEIAEQESEEEDELSEEEINAMSYEELESLCKDNEIDIPEEVSSLKTKDKKQKALAEYVISLLSEEEEPTSEEPPEEKEEKTAEDEDNYPASEERLAKEQEVADDIRERFSNKKLTIAAIKKELKKYYEGDADCKDCKGCSEEEIIECYSLLHQAFVDDDGELVEAKEPYYRNEKVWCCGKESKEHPDKEGTFVCEICGGEIEVDE